MVLLVPLNYFPWEAEERGAEKGKKSTGCLVSPICVAAIIMESLDLGSGNFSAFYVTHTVLIAFLLIL